MAGQAWVPHQISTAAGGMSPGDAWGTLTTSGRHCNSVHNAETVRADSPELTTKAFPPAGHEVCHPTGTKSLYTQTAPKTLER
jgi:hypothetical protein